MVQTALVLAARKAMVVPPFHTDGSPRMRTCHGQPCSGCQRDAKGGICTSETYPEDASVVDEGAALVVVLVQVLRDRACTACQDLELKACMAAVQVHATDLIPAAVDDRV